MKLAEMDTESLWVLKNNLNAAYHAEIKIANRANTPTALRESAKRRADELQTFVLTVGLELDIRPDRPKWMR